MLVDDVTRGHEALRQSRLKLAARFFEAALLQNKSEQSIARTLGQVLERLDHLPQAISLYQQWGDCSWAQLGWVRCRIKLGDVNAVASLSATVADAAASDVLRAESALLRKDHSAALHWYRVALERDAKMLPALLGVGSLTVDEIESANVFQTAMTLSHAAPPVAAACAQRQFQKGRLAECLEICDSVLRLKYHAGCVALKARVLSAVGRRGESAELLETQFLVSQVDIETAELAEAVAREVETHPSTMSSPSHHATVGGFHTGELFGEDDGVMSSLESAIAAQVGAYFSALPTGFPHVFVSKRPSAVALSGWGVVLQGKAVQSPHLHPDAWLSGVYYARVPASLVGLAGTLELNARPDDGFLAATGKAVNVRPKVGGLVLFPASLWHRTIATECDDVRVSVAFDVVGA